MQNERAKGRKEQLLIDRAALLRGFGQVAGDVGCKLIEVWGGWALSRGL
jgi:hypothetical protein